MRRIAPWVDESFHWGSLRALGNSRLVTTSIVWLFVVPIAAKLLAPFAGQHTLNLSWFDPGLSEPIAVTIALPFSWQRFYLMSWLFIIGQAVYWLACPEIVRRYANYGDYRRDHTGPTQLRVFLSRALLRPSEAARKKIIGMTGAEHVEPKQPQAVYDAVLRTLQSHPRDGAHVPEILQNQVVDAVLVVERHARRLWLWVSGMFFAGGLVLFAWVVGEGVYEVCKLL